MDILLKLITFIASASANPDNIIRDYIDAVDNNHDRTKIPNLYSTGTIIVKTCAELPNAIEDKSLLIKLRNTFDKVFKEFNKEAIDSLVKLSTIIKNLESEDLEGKSKEELIAMLRSKQ